MQQTSFPLNLKRRLTSTFLKKQRKQLSGVSQPSSLIPLFADPTFDPERTPVLLFPNNKQALEFIEQTHFFSPHLRAHLLSEYDVTPYSGLPVSPQVRHSRLHWLWRAQNPRPQDIFLMTVPALMQKSLDFQSLNQKSISLQSNSELPKDFFTQLDKLGYQNVSLVEDPGQYSNRGGIVDIFSPSHQHPFRLELFGDTIESIRSFNPDTQRSLQSVKWRSLIQARETLLSEIQPFELLKKLKELAGDSSIDLQELTHALNHQNYHPSLDFLYTLCSTTSTPLDHFNSDIRLWVINPLDGQRQADNFWSLLKEDSQDSDRALPLPPETLYSPFDLNSLSENYNTLSVSNLSLENDSTEDNLSFITSSLPELKKQMLAAAKTPAEKDSYLKQKLESYFSEDYKIFVSIQSEQQRKKIPLICERLGFHFVTIEEDDFDWESHFYKVEGEKNTLVLVQRPFSVPLKLSDEKILILPGTTLNFKSHVPSQKRNQSLDFQKRAQSLSFGDLKPGQLVVHSTHGVGRYEGFKSMELNGVKNEFLQISYKENDRLYLPVYRIGQIQKYVGANQTKILDKLGGNAWKQTKTKVKNKLRDIAADLLKLYAQREESLRPPFSEPGLEYEQFSSEFPFEETQDQLTAIDNILTDLNSERSMDRLICGDVGFGKTEVAMRAAFKIVEDGKQVIVIAPTTVLSLQHYESFTQRFKNWPTKIVQLNRFVPPAEIKKSLELIQTGEAKIIIGTHRVLSQDVKPKNLGLLIIDEEQKFGVKHKEKIRTIKVNIDTLALSATPIPRTLNMSLIGIRDLSLITTPPVDRLPTRTYLCQSDQGVIKKAVENELQRGGQIFFVHNRVQSIYGVADELRNLLPDVRMRVAHGQMDEKELEKTVMDFFNHKFDLLICTTIIESGIDVPNANTMFIDRAHQYGLSQLYQLRGRVGRSKNRAYCYLLVPTFKSLEKEAQERLKVIQENTALGSGMKVAQYDLELRGAGNILGESQSGHIQSIGYEMYMELLQEAIQEERGLSDITKVIDPEINLRIPAYIPDNYIKDIRSRLSYYKTLSNILSEAELEKIEDELKDQFGPPPEEVINLMGLMLIRKICKDLKITDLTGGKGLLSLTLDEETDFDINKVMKLVSHPSKKYALAPNNKLKVRLKEITWPRVVEELEILQRKIL